LFSGGSGLSSPGPQQRRFAAYIEGLAKAAGHVDRHIPLKNYCTGLLLPGERKSVEPMAVRLAPDNVRRVHQSLHQLVAEAPWPDEEMLEAADHGEARSGSGMDHWEQRLMNWLGMNSEAKARRARSLSPSVYA